MFVKYFIPEDGDEQAHPNIFRLDATQPTLADIRSAFPVPGSYHFRFLKNIGSHIVWLDTVDDGSALPVFQGNIFIKVSRVANTSSSVPSVGHGISCPGRNMPQPEPSPRANEPASAPPPVKAPKPSVEKQKSEKLLNFNDDTTVSPSSNGSEFTASVPAASSGVSFLPESDLLGISSSSADSVSHRPPVASTSTSDFFGMDTLQPTSAPASGSMGASSQRSLSPMNPMAAAAGMSSGGVGPMGGMNGVTGRSSMNPMNASQGVMGGGRGPQGGMQQGRGAPPPQQQQQQQRGMGGGPGTPGYDPFNNIAGLNGMSGTGSSGRR